MPGTLRGLGLDALKKLFNGEASLWSLVVDGTGAVYQPSAVAGSISATGPISTNAGLTVSAGGASIGGNTAVTGTLSATGNITSSAGNLAATTGSVSAGTTLSAAGMRASATPGAGQGLPVGTIYRDTASRGWVILDATGAIVKSVNVASAVRNSAGNYTVTLVNGVGSGEYLLAHVTPRVVGPPPAVPFVDWVAGPATSITIRLYESSSAVGTATDSDVFVSFWGG